MNPLNWTKRFLMQRPQVHVHDHFRYVSKLFLDEIFSFVLISFIETDLSHWVSLGMCALLSLKPDFPWSCLCRRACPAPCHNSSLRRNFAGGLGWCGGTWWGGQTGLRASLWYSPPLFYMPPFVLTHFCSIEPSGTLNLLGPLGHSRIKTFLIPWKLPCGTFQTLLGKWHRFMTDLGVVLIGLHGINHWGTKNNGRSLLNNFHSSGKTCCKFFHNVC